MTDYYIQQTAKVIETALLESNTKDGFVNALEQGFDGLIAREVMLKVRERELMQLQKGLALRAKVDADFQRAMKALNFSEVLSNKQ